ncbi:hypothetical protein C8R44DRAFT_947548 [Mycena epipterygia]|nr:hypothetical protein C8R44DRAFT_947548 [Mycena epipterygia]
MRKNLRLGRATVGAGSRRGWSWRSSTRTRSSSSAPRMRFRNPTWALNAAPTQTSQSSSAPPSLKACYVPFAHAPYTHLGFGALRRRPLYLRLVRLVLPRVCKRQREHNDDRRPRPRACCILLDIRALWRFLLRESRAQSCAGGGGETRESEARGGPVEEMVVSRTAFGFGLFNLVFSLLPNKVHFAFRGAIMVSILAFSSFVPRAHLPCTSALLLHRPILTHAHLSLRLVLTIFHGVVLLSGYQADEARTIRTYKGVVDVIEARYPTGALWILNRSKILRMSGDAQGAIAVLQRGLEASQTFVQAACLSIFNFCTHTLLAQRRYQEAADAFVRLTKLNSWSHATYYFIAAGCYVSLGNCDKAQELLDAVPDLLLRKNMGRKDSPTGVLIRKKVEFYKEKQNRRGGDPARYVECIRKVRCCWNTHQRIEDAVAEGHIKELAALTPHVALAVQIPFSHAADEKHVVTAEVSPFSRFTPLLPAIPSSSPDILFPSHPHPPHVPYNYIHQTTAQASADLHAPDERALRLLLLGIMHRTLHLYTPTCAMIETAHGMQGVHVSTWIAGITLFELAMTDLKEADTADKGEVGVGMEKEVGLDKKEWARVLAGPDAMLDGALEVVGKSNIDLSARLDSRITLLRDEIATQRGMMGI